MAKRAITLTPQRSDLRGIARRAVILAANMMAQRSAFLGNDEPSLDEVMEDPVIQALMARDGVAEESLRGMLKQIQGSLGRV